MKNHAIVALALVAAAASCKKDSRTDTSAATTTTSADAASSVVKKYAMERAAFNDTAFRLNLPVYWTADKNHDGNVDPDEVAALLFYPTEGRWVSKGSFTDAVTSSGSMSFESAFAMIRAAASAATPSGPDAERRKLVLEELSQGATTLVYSDLKGLTPSEKGFVGHMLAAAKLTDTLYATQTGAVALEKQLPKDEPASLAIFRRNWGPKCTAPKTENNAACSAIPGAPRPTCDAYPAELQKDAKFCEALEKSADAKKLLTPFVNVREQKGHLVPESFSDTYKVLMGQIATELRAGADALKDDPKEAALRTYLTTAAQSYTTNDWLAADEAWAKMNATNSKWYVRVAPDEVYWDPCAQKAGFHLALALINPDSLAWQQKLLPVQTEMEQNLAERIGAPYKARKVTFHLPDFIDIVFNAGDDRHPMGGTVGQSLPNWGKVSAEGRGRTVAMSNLYNDPDSKAGRRKQGESLLSKYAMSYYPDSAAPGLLATILHEATHNLGPAHDYQFQGKTDAKAFGGGMAAMLEELKAQTGGLYYVEFLRKKGIITDLLAKQTYVDSIVWAFGHISRGMYTEAHGRKAYSQLAAVQIGFLMGEGAVTWDAFAEAANGSDKGAFTIDFDKLVPAIDKMMTVVGGIKAKNDSAAALALVAKYVDAGADGKTVVPQAIITERELRIPKPAFVYGVEL